LRSRRKETDTADWCRVGGARRRAHPKRTIDMRMKKRELHLVQQSTLLHPIFPIQYPHRSKVVNRVPTHTIYLLIHYLHTPNLIVNVIYIYICIAYILHPPYSVARNPSRCPTYASLSIGPTPNNVWGNDSFCTLEPSKAYPAGVAPLQV